MSLLACINRCPATTRWPWLVYSLAPTNRLSTDVCASFTRRNSGSDSARPKINTLPAPGTDAAHADDLAGQVGVPERLEQETAVGLQRAPVGGDQAEQLRFELR